MVHAAKCFEAWLKLLPDKLARFALHNISIFAINATAYLNRPIFKRMGQLHSGDRIQNTSFSL